VLPFCVVGAPNCRNCPSVVQRLRLRSTVRFGLGAMVGLLISWGLTCLILGFTFWDKVGLISGSIVVFFYSNTRAIRVCEEDFRVQKVEDPIVGILAV